MLPNRVPPSELFGSLTHQSDWSRDSQFSELSSSLQSVQSQAIRPDFSQTSSQQRDLSQTSVLAEKTVGGESCQLNSYYLNYVSQPHVFKKPSDKGKGSSQPSLTEMMKLKYQTHERDTRVVFDSLSSLFKQCTAEVKDGIQSLQELIKSQVDASESHSSHTVNEVTKVVASQQAGLLEELSHKLELQEKKIDHLACELKQRDEKTAALLKEAELGGEKRSELCSLSENVKQCEEEMRRQRELIIKEVKETVMSIVSKLGMWNENWPRRQLGSIRANETERQARRSEVESCSLLSASGSPLLNMTLPVSDVSAPEQSVPSCDYNSDTDSVGIESLFSETWTPDLSSPFSTRGDRNLGPHSYKHTKVVFLNSCSHTDEHQNRSEPQPLHSHSISQCDEGELKRKVENMGRQCLPTSSGSCRSSPTTLAPGGTSNDGKRRTRQKRPLVVEPTCDETARHISKVGALLSHRSRSDCL